MWYECIPSMAIITVCLSLGNVAAWACNKISQGNAYNRVMDERFDRIMFVRDKSLTGDAYKCNGLETIPDEPEKTK